MEEKDLQHRVEQLEKENINLRFDKVEKELSEIKDLLKEYVAEIKANREEALTITKGLDTRVTSLEETRRNCPIKVVKAEVHRYAIETSFIRAMFKNPWKGAILMSLWITLIVILIIAFGPGALFEGLMKLKGM